MTFSQRDINLYMDIAERVAKQSYAQRLQVGAVFVAESGVMTIGYNGTSPGEDNCCEHREERSYHNTEHAEILAASGWSIDVTRDRIAYRLTTKPSVLHAEENILGKLLEEGISARNGSFFMTHSPCPQCAKMLKRIKLASVYYRREYRSSDGIKLLLDAGIDVHKV